MNESLRLGLLAFAIACSSAACIILVIGLWEMRDWKLERQRDFQLMIEQQKQRLKNL